MNQARKPTTPRASGEGGFTLVEIAIVMLISSIIMAALAQGFSIYNYNKRKQETLEHIKTIYSALGEFQSLNGYFPCPADPALPTNDPNYGEEKRTTPYNPATPCNLPTTAGNRDTRADTAAQEIPAGTDLVDPVVIGSVPYKTMTVPFDEDGNPATPPRIQTLQYVPLRGKDILDGWKNKITYAVSERLTSTIYSFNTAYGVINVVDESNNSVVPVVDDGSGNPPPANMVGTAQAVLVSHGENGRGAYTAEGAGGGCGGAILPAPPVTIPPTVATPKSEIENCNGDGTFLSGLKNLSEHSYNDDITTFVTLNNRSLWQQVGTDAYNTNAGNVGFGANAPTQPLTVEGTLTGDDLISDQLCDENGTNCMPVGVITGNLVKCAGATERLTGITSNQAECASPAFVPPVTPISCLADGTEYLGGVMGDGRINCCKFDNSGCHFVP